MEEEVRVFSVIYVQNIIGDGVSFTHECKGGSSMQLID